MEKPLPWINKSVPCFPQPTDHHQFFLGALGKTVRHCWTMLKWSFFFLGIPLSCLEREQETGFCVSNIFSPELVLLRCWIIGGTDIQRDYSMVFSPSTLNFPQQGAGTTHKSHHRGLKMLKLFLYEKSTEAPELGTQPPVPLSPIAKVKPLTCEHCHSWD